MVDADPEVRIVIEHPLGELPALVRLQESLQLLMPRFRPRPSEDMHVTFLHIGRPVDLHANLSSYGLKLGLGALAEGLWQFASEHANAITDGVLAEGFRLEYFGSVASPMLVLTLDIPQELYEARGRVVQSLEYLLKQMGLNDPLDFMAGDSNLQYSPNAHYHPHVSLGRLPRGDHMPYVDVRGMRLLLPPTRIRDTARFD